MDQHRIEIPDGYSAEIEEPAGAAVGEAFSAHEGSEEAPEVSSPSLIVQSDDSRRTSYERSVWTFAQGKGLKPTKINLWKVVYEDCSESRTRFQNVIYKREEEMRSVKNEIYQVVGFFSAFQGLLITAAAQSILLHCNNVGFIFALSAFATAVAVCGIWQKITVMEELRSDIISNDHVITELTGWMSDLRRGGINYKIESLHHRSPPTRLSHTGSKEILLSYGFWLLVSVIAFGGLCMVAMRQILCNPGHSLPSV